VSESANERRLDPLVGFQSVFSTPPDFVNAEGVKWWRDKDVERYANNEDQHGTRLCVEAWIVERPDGYRTRLLIEGGKIIEEAQSLEAIGAKIDWLKCATRFDEVKPNGGLTGDARSGR